MIRMIQTEFVKLKRFHILWVGLIGMLFTSILSVFTQVVSIDDAKVANFDFIALYESCIWNSVTIIMPIIFTLIGGYLINREYTDNTLKNILPVPIRFQRLLFAKLLTMGILSILLGLYNFLATLLIGWLSGLSGLSASILFTNLIKMLAISVLTYIAILPIIAFTSRKPGIFTGGVIVSFLLGYATMFIKNATMRSLYPIYAGLTLIHFDTETFMNTSDASNLTFSICSLTVMLLLTILIVITSKPPQEKVNKNKKAKTSNLFLRQGQK